MFKRFITFIICLLTAFSAFPQVPATPPQTPESVVKDLYKHHDEDQSPFFQTKSRASVDLYFVKKLADLIWKDVVSHQDEVGAIGADPLYNAQDMDIKKRTFGKAAIQNGVATVTVSFENFGEKQKVQFLLRQEKERWKIENIKYADGSSLMGWLTAN